MTRPQNGYPIPSNVEYDRFKCIQLFIPDDWEWYSTVWGHLYELSKWYNWQRDDLQSGKFMADWFKIELDRARRQFDFCNSCDPHHVSVDLTAGDGGLTYQEDFDIGCGAQQTPYVPSYGWGFIECDANEHRQSGWGVREDFSSVRDIINPDYSFNIQSGGNVEYWQTELYWIDADNGYHFWNSIDGLIDGNYQHVVLGVRRNVKGLFYRILAYHSNFELFPPITYMKAFEYDFVVIPDCNE